MTNGDDSGVTRRSFIGMTAATAAASLTGVTPTEQRAVPADVHWWAIEEAAAQLRAKKITSVELTRACLERIEKYNPTLNAFITVTADMAMTQAREADAEISRGRIRGPLHGIPIALKDLFDTAGVRTTAGSNVWKDRVPTDDAEVVRRLKAAGAVIVGKTNMHEWAFGGTSAVSAFGPVRNPWSTDRIAGGSSGGSTAALAAGMCFGALGSDTAGSIRQPAAYCGVVGLKPSYGLVSARGAAPLSWSLDHIGPFARTVGDVALMLTALAGYDPGDITSGQFPAVDYSKALAAGAARLRVGVNRDFFFSELDGEISMAMAAAIGVLQRITSGVRDISVPATGQEALRAAIRSAEAYTFHAGFVEKTPELYQPETLQRLKSASDVKTAAFIHAQRELNTIRRTYGKVFDTVDVVVTPTVFVQPPLVADVTRDMATSMSQGAATLRNTSPFNVYGWPTVSVPCGFTRGGLPVGLQISSAMGQDAVALRVARAYEAATQWSTRHPQL